MNEYEPPSRSVAPVSIWLDVLNAVIPLHGALVVGAGTGNSQWIQWLKGRNISRVRLVEGDKLQFQHLERCISSGLEWTLRHAVVAETADIVEFHHASNSTESGLIAPEQLHCLWPHLESLRVEKIKPLPLAELFTQETGDINWLVLDCLTSSSLLTASKQLLRKLDVLIIRVTLLDDLPAINLSAADTILSEAGFRCIQVLPERHPALAHAIYVRDIGDQKTSIERNKHDIEQLQGALQKVKNQLDQQQAEYAKELDDARSQLEQKNQELELTLAEKNSLHQELDRLRNAEEHLRHTLCSANSKTESQALEIEQLKTRFEGDLAKQFSILDKMTTSTNQLALQQTELIKLEHQGQKDLSALVKKELDAKLGKAVRHVEAFIAIQQYLTHGDGITGFHGWPISPDLGVFLLERLRERQYDVIIEFGSGTSTLLLAKALQAFNLVNDGDSKRILSFDHDAYYFEKTKKMLASNQIDSLVDLRLAPLTEWSDETGSYKYYNCQEALNELSERLQGTSKRLLVLVDGPPSSTCPNARYPAVPFMSDLLEYHEIDWVLDDAYRPDEKFAADTWKNLWAINHICFDDELIRNEKGMFISTTYGKICA